MTPQQLMTLIGLWRQSKKDHVLFPSDVAREVAVTANITFGEVRAANCLRQLRDQKLIKLGSFGSCHLTPAGKKLCNALAVMGLYQNRVT